MLPTLAALLAFAAADPVVVALPLAAGEGASKKEAAGLDAIWRERLEAAGIVRLLARTRADDDASFRCGRDPGCLGRVATERGADLIIAGAVDETSEGFFVRVLVVEAGAERALRTADQPVMGTRENMGEWLDRLVRLALQPAALAGGLMVLGSPAGATVTVDGKDAGVVPFEEPLAGIVEGTHTIRIEHPGYAAWERRVDIRFREVARVDMTLRALGVVVDETPEVDVLYDVVPWVGVGVGALLLAGGAVFGTLSTLDAIELERRAQQGVLFFPKDADLLSRGEFYAWTANGMYVAGAAVAVGGAALWVVGLAARSDDERDEVVAAPAEGAPDWEDLRPGEVVP